MNRKAAISLVVGLALSAGALYLAFRNVPLRDLAAYLGTINYLWILPAVVLVVASFALRALRWRVILGRSGNIGFTAAFHPLMIGFMLNCILPGRVGELARPVILSQRDKVALGTGLASIVAERLFDIAFLVALFALVLAFVPIDPELVMTFGSYRLDGGTLKAILRAMLQAMAALVAAIFLVSAGPTRRWITRAILASPDALVFLPRPARRWLADRPAAGLARLVESVAGGLEAVRNPRAVAICSVYSAGVWGLQGISFWAVSLGCPGVGLSLAQAFAVLVIICFFIALPSVPGFWGLWEAGGVFALALFGIAGREAAGFTLANHAIQMFPVIAVGLMSAFAAGIDFRQLSGRARTES